MELYNWVKRKVCAEEKENLFIIKSGDVCEFIDKQLRKEYIILLKSSQTILVFFIKKKNTKKIIQNYRYLNEWTIKNNYSLSLILNIVENINTKKSIY